MHEHHTDLVSQFTMVIRYIPACDFLQHQKRQDDMFQLTVAIS